MAQARAGDRQAFDELVARDEKRLRETLEPRIGRQARGKTELAMEYADGATSAQVLARIREAEPGSETPFGAKDEVPYFGNLAKAFADVADGLQHAHSTGVIHRDISRPT